jgi:cytochrome d ubiquinol oxidase subunit II
VVVSALAGLAALGLLLRRRAAPARYAAALTIAALVVGWALAQSPQLLPGLTVAQAAAPRSTLIATTVAVVVGFIVVAPSLGLLFRLVLHGRFERVPRSSPAVGTVQPPSEATRRRRAGASALTFVLGAVVVVFGTTVWPQVVGVLLLLVSLAGGFAAVGPAELADEHTLDGAQLRKAMHSDLRGASQPGEGP